MQLQNILLTLVFSFLVTVLLCPFFIPYLKRLKFGQNIREDGPASHQTKSGTPTMGGIVILLALILATIVMSVKTGLFSGEMVILLFVTAAYGTIGFLDDYIKVVKKRNLGLTAKQKLIGQIMIAVVFSVVYFQQKFSTILEIPGIDFTFELGWLYPLLILIMLVGSSNAVNLTDGLDGLLAGTSAIAFSAFTVIAYAQGQTEIALFCLAVTGAFLGFLVFNAHPAKVFMGDTGSLALGGALAAVAILLKTEILLILIGGIFVIEALSVILQVISFQTTGRRIFRMAPLHHHYELKGWSEWTVVVVFWLVGLLFAILGIYIEVWK